MTIFDVLNLFCFPDDQFFKVYDFASTEDDAIIFEGYINECDESILEMTCDCIDNMYPDSKYMIFNVDSDNEN